VGKISGVSHPLNSIKDKAILLKAASEGLAIFQKNRILR